MLQTLILNNSKSGQSRHFWFFAKDGQENCLEVFLAPISSLTWIGHNVTFKFARVLCCDICSKLWTKDILIFFIKLKNQIDINNSRLRYARQMRFFAKVSLDNYLKVILTSMSNLVSIGHNLPFKSARVPYFDFFLLN